MKNKVVRIIAFVMLILTLSCMLVACRNEKIDKVVIADQGIIAYSFCVYLSYDFEDGEPVIWDRSNEDRMIYYDEYQGRLLIKIKTCDIKVQELFGNCTVTYYDSYGVQGISEYIERGFHKKQKVTVPKEDVVIHHE